MAHSYRQGTHGGHAVYIRDYTPVSGKECLNSGFIAIRNSPAGRLLLQLWKAKLQWPGICTGDQCALAESILELLAMEMADQSRKRFDYAAYYNHECLPEMFPDGEGHENWLAYCVCWTRATVAA